MELIKSVSELAVEIANEPSPTRGLEILLRKCVSMTEASTGRLYMLRVAKFAFVLAAQVGRSDSAPEISLASLRASPRSSSVLEEAILLGKPKIVSSTLADRGSASSGSRLIVPFMRDNSCLGFIDMDAPRPEHFTKAHTDAVGVAAGLALLLLEKDDALELLRNSERPLDFSQRLEEFLADVVLLIAAASRMPFIALRKLVTEEESLRCIETFGFNPPDKGRLDLTPIDAYPSFKRAVDSGKTVVELDMKAAHLDNLRSLPELKDVESFVVCPIKVGTTIYGTLSFAAPCTYPYSELDIAGFELIANGIGVAITNYQNFHAVLDADFQLAQAGAALTAVEVAQAARHKARTRLEEANAVLATLLVQARKGREGVAAVTQRSKEIGDILLGIGLDLDRIRDVMKPPLRELRAVSLNKTWEEAFSLVRTRLDSLEVSYSVRGQNVTIEAYPDFLKHAWLNLILNSIDAFKDRRQKSNRLITVTIDPVSEAATDAHVRYVDNAQGIDPSKLRPSLQDQQRSVNDIFEPGISSKPEGSGYGLVLVRKILTQHSGSIDLSDWRNGVVFDIRIRKRHTS